MFQHAREPMNSLTHFIGAVVFSIGVVVLLVVAMQRGASVSAIVGAVVFGVSLVLLYSASSIYHYVNKTTEQLVWLRKLDHAMIYVLIAGSYTPLLLSYSQNGLRITLAIWALALVGIILKLCWKNMPRVFSTVLYVALGWSIVLDPSSIIAMPRMTSILLLVGGLFYTVGAVIYAFKKPKLSWIGFHELFHLFVLAGSAAHFVSVIPSVL